MQQSMEAANLEPATSNHEPRTADHEPAAKWSSTDDRSPSPGEEGRVRADLSSVLPHSELCGPSPGPPAIAAEAKARGEGGLSQFSVGSRRLTGKVAALPKTIRVIVNRLLDDGVTYKVIVQHLQELGYPGFLEQNIQRWKARGYDEWVRTQRELDLEKARQESFAELYKNSKEKSNLTEASQYLAALQTYRALTEMQDHPASEIMGSRANDYFRLMRLVNRQGAEQTRRERLAWKKDTSEKSIIDQLLADPGKLEALLTAVRDRIARTANTSTHE